MKVTIVIKVATAATVELVTSVTKRNSQSEYGRSDLPIVQRQYEIQRPRLDLFHN